MGFGLLGLVNPQKSFISNHFTQAHRIPSRALLKQETNRQNRRNPAKKHLLTSKPDRKTKTEGSDQTLLNTVEKPAPDLEITKRPPEKAHLSTSPSLQIPAPPPVRLQSAKAPRRGARPSRSRALEVELEVPSRSRAPEAEIGRNPGFRTWAFCSVFRV